MATIYLAGPITGLTYDEAVAWRAQLERPLLAAGWHVLNPMRGKEDLHGQGAICALRGTKGLRPAEIFHRDRHDIQRADVVVFDFRGAAEKSVGSCWEHGYAYAHDKYIVLLMDEGNPHDHLFLNTASNIRFKSLDHCVRFLTEPGGYL